MSLLQRTPFFQLLLALVAGIVLYQYVQIPSAVLVGSFVLSLFLIVASFFIEKSPSLYRLRHVFGIGTMLCTATIAYYLCLSFEQRNAFTELNHRAIYEVELTSAPQEKERSYSVQVKLLQRYDSISTTPVSGNAMVYIQKDSLAGELLLGDRMMIDAEFKAPDGVQNPNGFDYAKYLKRQGVGATVYLASEKWQKTGQNTSFSLKRFANKSRNHLLEIYKKYGVDGAEFAVLAALTLGYKDSLEPDIYQLYSHTGAVHILSVSGLHVGIVYGAIYLLLGFLNKNRRQRTARSLISIAFIWGYAIITGLAPAVMRASLMLTIAASATFLNRRPQIYNSVLASAFLLLLFKPNLIFNIGFQLSYSAVLSIVAYQKSISKLLVPTNKFGKWLWDLTSVSVAAQLGTAPISIYYFNQFPNYFLLTNYVAIPLSSVIIYSAILLLFISFIPLIATVVAFALKWTIWGLNYLLGLIVSLPGSISVISITSLQMIMLIAAILFFTSFAYNKKFAPLAIGLSLILGFFVNLAWRQYESINGSKMIIFSDNRTPIINFIDGKNNYVYTSDELKALNVGNAYWRSSLLKTPDYIQKNEWFDDGFANFKEKRILVLKDDLLRYKMTEQPLEVDYLIITNRLRPRINEILELIVPQKIIVDKSISNWYTNSIREACEENNIEFYSVAENGAYIADF